MTAFSHRRKLLPTPSGGKPSGSKIMAREIVEFCCGQMVVKTVNIASAPEVYVEAVNDSFINSVLAPQETWTLEALTATTFSVTGSVSGVIDGSQNSLTVTNCQTGILYTNGLVQFTIPARDYIAGDSIALVVTHGLRRLTVSVYFGDGSGTISALNYFQSILENFTLVAVDATTFTVTGSVAGSMPNLVVGQRYNSDFNPLITQLSILVEDGLEDFVVGDRFVLTGSYSVLPQADRWEVLYGDGGQPAYNDESDSDSFKALLRGPGMLGVGSVFAGFECKNTATVNTVAAHSGTDFVAGALQNTITTYMPFPKDGEIDAFMRVTRRNIVAGFNVGQSYGDQIYAGLLKSFLAPGAHPYPFYLAGSGSAAAYPYAPSSPSYGASGLSHNYGKYMRTPGLATEDFDTTNSYYPAGYVRNFVPIDVPQVIYVGVGNGILEEARREHFNIAVDTLTVTLLTDSTFSVGGLTQGAMASGVVGTEYRDGGYLFTLQSGSAAFQAGDEFTVSVLPQELLIPLSLNQYGEMEGCYMASNRTLPGDIIIVDNVNYIVSSDLTAIRSTAIYQNRFAIRMD